MRHCAYKHKVIASDRYKERYGDKNRRKERKGSEDRRENQIDVERKKVQFAVLPQGKAAISRLSSSIFPL